MAQTSLISTGSDGRRRHIRGFSLAEIVVVIAVIGIMAGIGIVVMTGVISGTSLQTAERNLNYLNGAVVAFNQANWELVLASDSSANDEQAIFNSLRFRDVANPSPGSPYLPATTVYVASSSLADYRAVWNGRMFQLAVPSSNGAGINLLRMSGAAPQAFVTNTPVPRQTN